MPLDRRVSMLMKDPEVDNASIEEYKKTELLRRSVADVRKSGFGGRELVAERRVIVVQI